MARPKKPVSHDAGGPSASRGPAYQTYFAIYQTLELIVRHFAAPHKALAIRIEPRVVHRESGSVTAWDVWIEADAIAWEAKLNVTRRDVIEWLQRIENTGEPKAPTKFGLVYGQTITPLLAALERFHRVAVECEGDDQKFDILAIDTERLSVISSALGPGFRDHLRQMVFLPVPEPVLRKIVEDRAMYLAGADSNRLVAFLFKTFSEGAAQRQQYKIADLCERIQNDGINMSPPARFVLADVPVKPREAIMALAVCQSGLPRQALAAMLGLEPSAMETELRPFILHGLIVEEGDILRAAASYPEQEAPSPHLAAVWLDPLLTWLMDNETLGSSASVARGALSLAKRALQHRPGLSLKFFQATEHAVKNLGDKHLLLEISELCIHSANDPSPLDRDLKAMAKAQAMLCGHSWVWQRTGRRSEARMMAEKSEQLGEDIGWRRNTAFAKKCVARIDRVEAEHSGNGAQRDTLLSASATKLHAAIGIFSQLSDFGPNSRQVGDCHSLLARTQLVAGDLDGATESLRDAHNILLPAATKEYFDLLILTGDIEIAKDHPEAAEDHYTKVIGEHVSGNREISEICARAHFKRGQLRAKRAKKVSAADDFDRAAETWHSLDEPALAADAEWARLQLDSRLDHAVLRSFLTVEPVLIRVAAVREYQARLQSMKVVARRAIPTKSQVEQLAKDARKRMAEEHPEW